MKSKITTIILICILCGISFCDSMELDDEINQILSEIEEKRGNINNNNLPKSGNMNRMIEDKRQPDRKDHYSNIAGKSLQPIPEGNFNKNDNNKELFREPKSTDCMDECVPFYQCNNGSVVTSGESLIDIRLNDGPCGNVFLTCCKLDQVTSQRFQAKEVKVPTPKGCGYRQPDGIGIKITGAVEGEAQFAEFPWMVSIIKYDGSQGPNPRPHCGASLIHARAVITAAHCVSDRRQRWKVRAGEWDINRTIEPIPHQEVDVEDIIIHRDYYPGALYFDIAFLYLKTPIKMAENAAPICISPQNYKHRPNRCFVTGWGKDRFGREGRYHIIMKKIDVPIVSRARCQQNLRSTRLGIFFQLHPSFMCAGGEKGKDACNGDGGGPLVCPIEHGGNRYYQAGIVSWGIGCGIENVPGVYVDVATFRNWIDALMRRFNLDTESYKVGDVKQYYNK